MSKLSDINSEAEEARKKTQELKGMLLGPRGPGTIYGPALVISETRGLIVNYGALSVYWDGTGYRVKIGPERLGVFITSPAGYYYPRYPDLMSSDKEFISAIIGAHLKAKNLE